MKISKKLLTLALAAMLLLSLAVPAMADEYYEKLIITNGFYIIEIHDPEQGTEVILNEYIVDEYDGPSDIVIPDGVTVVGLYVFADCENLTSVTIPASVTIIQNYAFDSCTSLKSVTIPASVTEIYENIFSGCTSLTDIYFGGTEAQWAAIEKKLEERGAYYNEKYTIFGDGVNPTVHYNSNGPAASTEQPTTPAAPKVQLSSQPLTVDGKAVSAQAYNIGGSNFFKLRDVAMMLNGTAFQFSVGYDAATRAVTATSGEAYTAAGGELTAGEDKSASCVVSDQPIYVDGVKLDVTVYNIGGSNYFMLRDLGEALGFGVAYDNATRTVLVTTK